MLIFPEFERVIYNKNPLIQVVCQLRFPTLLIINTNEPSEFQESIRDVFPQYEVIKEHHQEIALQQQGDRMILPEIPQTRITNNYKFSSKDDKWYVNLTNTFLSLSTNNYVRWEEFLEFLKQPLEALVRIYRPSYINRIGLRYIDAFSRKQLELEDAFWHELIKPFALGFLSAEDVPEDNVSLSNLETELSLNKDNNRAIIRTSLGLIDNNPEKHFIIDSDFFTSETIEIETEEIEDNLDFLHTNATRFLRWVIEDKLHNAMEPKKI